MSDSESSKILKTAPKLAAQAGWPLPYAEGYLAGHADKLLNLPAIADGSCDCPFCRGYRKGYSLTLSPLAN